jgi:Spy/CpxP family protein refolding chaperone
MRNSYLTAGFLSMALSLAMNVPAAAQSSTTNPPEQKPPEAASPSAPPQSTPSQAAPSQAGAASEAAPGPAQSQAQTREDNPLNLTDEQKAKLRPILVEQNQQLDALRNDTSMTQEQKVSKANEIREAASPKIRAILTPEQLQKLAELQQKAKQQQKQSTPPKAASPPHP